VIVAPFAEEVIFSFQLPLSGSLLLHAGRGPARDLSTPSLGITVEEVRAIAELARKFFQLPLSGSRITLHIFW
jgi:hypothetical protein